MRRGLALIIVVGVLGVLSVLAVVFVTMAQLERKASAQRVNAAKAYLLAKSGIEDALARVALGQDPNDPFNRYEGEDWDADGKLSAYETKQKVYNPGGSKPDIDSCPVRDAMHPSYPVWNIKPGKTWDPNKDTPLVVTLDGRDRGYSGTLSGDALPTGNTYALKVTSENGFDVNGGDLFPDGSGVPTYNSNLRNMLGSLANEMDREKSNNGIPVGQADGFALIDQRPPGGWTSFNQIRDVALGGSQDKLDALKPYLAIHVWHDTRVIRPNATDAMIGKFYRSWGEILLDRPVGRAGSRAPDFERVRGQVVGRAPVSLSWARSRQPALVALFSGLKGLYFDDFFVGTPYQYLGAAISDRLGVLRSEEVENLWANQDACHEVADAILGSTSELRTWQEWNDFVDSIPDAKLINKGGTAQHKREILKANFNPNSDLNKFNPNSTMWRPMDKSDLLAYSTEFDLAGGVQAQEVESIGRVQGHDGRVLATRTLRATLSWPRVVRLSTQKEFVCDNLGDLDLAGDESNFRKPGYQAGGNEAFISRSVISAGPPDERTWGQKLDTTALLPAANYSAGAGNWMNGSSNGASLQVYPEPYVDTGAGLSINPADYDGSIQLATLETPKDDYYSAGASTQAMTMLAHFDDAFEPDEAASIATWRTDCRTDVQQVGHGELLNSLWDSAKPNTLHPDGAYSERDRVPAFYDGQGNSDGFHGVLSFWVKPASLGNPVGGAYSRGLAYVMRTRVVDPDGGAFLQSYSQNQFFFLGIDHHYSSGLSTQFETTGKYVTPPGGPPADSGWERRYWVPTAPPVHRWFLVTFYWDFRANTLADQGQIYFNDGSVVSGANAYADTGTNIMNSAAVEDITQDDLSGPGHTPGHHMLSLGPLSTRDFYADVALNIGGGADATFDEFAIYNFGGALASPGPVPPDSRLAPAKLAKNRYQVGRYYPESRYVQNAYATNAAGEWFSAPINLGGGVAQLKGLSWTQIIPTELQPGAAIVFELRDASSPGNFAKDAGGSDIGTLFTDDRGSAVNRSVSSPFRLHAIFQPNLTAPFPPLLDTPVLDDITLIVSSTGGPHLLSWEEVVNE